MSTDNFRKHTSKNPLQKFLINHFLSSLLEEAKSVNPDKILDVGCGEGFMLNKLHENNIGRVLEGIDISEQAIKLGRQIHPGLVLREGSVYQLPYNDNAFDLVVCSEVLEHLERPEDALKELKRVTRRSCIISVPNEPYFRLANFLRGKNISRWGNDIEHIQHWSSRNITDFVAMYFEVKKVRMPFPWTIITARKI